MHTRAPPNRPSGSSFGSRVSVLLLAMFAAMATVYVAGRFGSFSFLFFFFGVNFACSQFYFGKFLFKE
jgi:hypothetical protein